MSLENFDILTNVLFFFFQFKPIIGPEWSTAVVISIILFPIKHIGIKKGGSQPFLLSSICFSFLFNFSHELLKEYSTASFHKAIQPFKFCLRFDSNFELFKKKYSIIFLILKYYDYTFVRFDFI